MAKKLLIGIFLLLLLLLPVGYIYFFVINPRAAEKPNIERPDITNPEIASSIREPEKMEASVSYFANEIGAYNLKKDPLSGEIPQIEFELVDSGKVYTISIIDSIPETSRGEAPDPDIRISCTQNTFIEIMGQDDIIAGLQSAIEEGKVGIEAITDQKTLALKGYKTLYDSLTAKNNMITGGAIREIDPLDIVSGIKLYFLLTLFITLEVAFLIESKNISSKSKPKGKKPSKKNKAKTLKKGAKSKKPGQTKKPKKKEPKKKVSVKAKAAREKKKR